MATINIGTIIATKRKEKGVTQEELAQHLGVSKPAVSKWESGQSYPDILLLPVIAAFFDISIDDLIGYEPQMTTKEIRKLYRRLANEFTTQPAEKVYEECFYYVKKYFSCWTLQFQMGLLLINHAALAGSPEATEVIIKKSLDIFKRIVESTEDISLAKQSLQMQAFCYLTLQQPIEAIDLLDTVKDPLMSTDTLLIKAYQMKGEQKKAIELIQGFLYRNLFGMIGVIGDLLMMYADQPEKTDQSYQIFLNFCQVFDVEQIQPVVMLQVHYVAAHVYMMQQRKEEALKALEQYLEAAIKSEHYDFHLQGNEFFDLIEEYFASLDLDTEAPRNEKTVRKDMKKLVLENPVFFSLEGEERFHRIKKRLELLKID